MSNVKSTWGKSKYPRPVRTAGHYTGVIVSAEKASSQKVENATVWFVNLSIDGKRNVQVQNRWVDDGQVKTVNALAMFIAGALDSLNIDYDETELADKSFEELMDIFKTKNLIGRKVHYELQKRQGETAMLDKVVFE